MTKINLYIKNKYNFRNYFCTPMIPYPSGSLHIGHIRNYLINDIFNRILKIKKYNIFNSIGWDCFGTPAENISIEKLLKPIDWINRNINYMKKQFKFVFFFNKWNKKFLTFNKNYYKKTQIIFKKLIKEKLLYLKKKLINWDPVEKSVLSNEQVLNGRGWRSGAKIKLLSKKTYFIKLTEYKKELLYEIKNLNWPRRVKLMQFNWLGFFNKIYLKLFFKFKKFLFLLKKIFNLLSLNLIILFKNFIIFNKFLKINYLLIFNKFLNKKNFNSSCFLKNTYNFKKNELWLIKSLKIKINKFILNNNLNFKFKLFKEFFFEDYEHVLINIYDINFKLKYFWNIKDWGVSRQRYWGTPIPVIICKECNHISYFYKNIKILPSNLKTSVNNNVLKKNLLFKYNICYKCKNICFSETDTIDTFFDSSWYFLNYLNFKKKNNNLNKWLPLNFYIGGIEHSILHLIYSRFIIKFLRDIKWINFGEPIKYLFTQGMILNKTYYFIENNKFKWISFNKSINNKANLIKGKIEKMSKSKKNGINPNFLIKNYGIDSLKISVIYPSYLDKDFFWEKKYIINSYFFLKKFWNFYTKKLISIKKNIFYKKNKITINNKLFLFYFYKNLNKINLFYINIKYNKILSIFFTLFYKIKKFNLNFLIFNEILSSILRFIYPIIPNISYKVWNNLKYNKEIGFIFYTFWPKIYFINLKKKKKYIFFINNKKNDLLYIKKDICLKKIINYMFFKKKFFTKNIIKKVIIKKNIINLIY